MPWVSHVLFWPDPVKLLPVFHLGLIAAELHVPSSNPFLESIGQRDQDRERDII
jgi:hypothetical protein